MTNGSSLRATIDRVDPELILVDFFDTLVTRTISGSAVKRVFARHVVEHFALSAQTDDVLNARLSAEQIVRRRCTERGDDPEHRIEEVADEMFTMLRAAATGGLPDDKTTFVARASQVEMAVEIAAQRLDHDVVDVLEQERGRRAIVLVSDFHFTADRFNHLLDHHGIAKLFDEVYVSCDVRRSKATGRLYDHVLASVSKSSSLTPDRVLMIGDNVVSDIENARKHGLDAHRIERPEQRGGRIGRRLTSMAKRPGVERRLAVRAALGSEDFAPLAATLFLFTRDLHAVARSEGIDPLIFLAREGQFLQQLFDRYQELSPAAAGSAVPSAYLVVSRRSTAIAGLAPIEEEDFTSILSKYPRMTFDDLIGSLGFSRDVAAEIVTGMGVDGAAKVDVERLRADEGFQRHYTARRLEQASLLQSYVERVSGAGEGGLSVVDVGWKGTIQDHLQAALGDRPIDGMYVGITDDAPVDGESKRGLLFDSRQPQTATYRVLRHSKSMYEFLLQANHGSAASYRLVDGVAEPELDHQTIEAEIFAEHIGPIQGGILDAFTQLCLLDGASAQPILANADDAAEFYARLLFFPRASEVEVVRSLRHYENFGEMGMIEIGGGAKATSRERLGNVVQLLRRPRQVIFGSGWPPVTLTRLGMRSLIPLLGVYRGLVEFGLPRLRALARRH